jgi:hypothetical protein
VIITKTDDSSTTGRKYQPRLRTAGSTAGSSAVAPAGGCVVRVNCIKAIAMAVEREGGSQLTLVGMVELGKLNRLVMTMPVKALMKWPPISARG